MQAPTTYTIPGLPSAGSSSCPLEEVTPKGIFLYRNHEEANRDRDRWVVEAIVEKQRHG